MTDKQMMRRHSGRPAWSRDRVEYRLVVALAFILCLGLAAGKRILGLGHAPRPNDRARGESMFAEARSSAHAAVGYAFMA